MPHNTNPTRPTRRAVLNGALGAAAVSVVGSGAALAHAAASPVAARGTAAGETRAVALGTKGGPGASGAGEPSGIATAVAVGDRYYLVDAGQGALNQLRKSNLGTEGRGGPLDELRCIFLTHLHSDHVMDLNNILNAGTFNGFRGLDRKVHIWGPGRRGALPPVFQDAPEPPVVVPENPTPGTTDMVQRIVEAFAVDFNDRVRDNLHPVPDEVFTAHDLAIPDEYTADPNGNPEPRMSPVDVYEDDRVKVTATLVYHAPIFPALAYRFDTEAGSIVVSGDTGPSENLVELAEEADVLFHEVISRQAMEETYPEPRTPEQEAILHHHFTAHTTIEDVGPIADRAGARTLVLHHFVPATRVPIGAWQKAGKYYSGRLVVAHDLDEINVG